MNIRIATYRDAPTIRLLLEALGYKTSLSLLVNQLEILFGQNDHQVFVCEVNKDVAGFITVHYVPQLGFDGGLMWITYLSVDENVKDQGIAAELERYITKQAKARKCDRIQVHCLDCRTSAHQFYTQQGYHEYPKFYTKRLVYGV